MYIETLFNETPYNIVSSLLLRESMKGLVLSVRVFAYHIGGYPVIFGFHKFLK